MPRTMQITSITKKASEVSNILEVLKKSAISSVDYVSSREPFFKNDNNSQPFQQFNTLFVNGEIPEGLNRNIKVIYELLGHSKREIYLDTWTIMCLDESLERYKELVNQGQTNVFDIGYKYGGMGYIDVLSCDLTSHLLFYRVDGGSNDYDRLYNLNQLIREGSRPYDKFYFSTWFYNM
jgi:hypothetical protein